MQAGKATLSFEQLYSEHADSVFRYCFRLCNGNWDDAQDLAQETLVAAFQSLPTFEGRASVRSWLYRIVYRHWLRRLGGVESVSLEAIADLPDPGGDSPEREIDRAWLADALEQLSEGKRQAVILVKMEGLTHREAAEVLGVREGTVLSQVHDGLKQLRRILAAESRIPLVTSILLAFLLDWRLRVWADATAPATLATRVQGLLGDSLTRPLRTNLSTPTASSSRLLPRSIAAGGMMLLLLVILWSQRDRIPALALRRSPIDPILRAMQGVSTAHATGSRTMFTLLTNGKLEQAHETEEYWFKAPGRFRRSLRGRRLLNSDLYLDRGRATGIAYNLDGSPFPIFMPAQEVETNLAPFSYFTTDGHLPRLAREGLLRTSLLLGDLVGRPVQILTLEYRTADGGIRWVLYADPTSHLVLRSDYRSEQLVRGRWVPAATGTLDSFEYDLRIPDRILTSPVQ